MTKNTGFVSLATLSEDCQINDNFYVEAYDPAVNVPLINALTYGVDITYSVTDNFFYVTGATKALSVGNLPAGENDDPTRKSGRPRPLTSTPLIENWSVANGVFGYKNDLMYYDNLGDTAPYAAVPVCGARR